MTKAASVLAWKYPRTGTLAAKDFLVTQEQIRLFLSFYGQLVTTAESTRKFFDLLRKSHPKIPNMNFHEREQTTALQEGIRHRQFFFEVILVRIVENYLNYFSSLLFEIYTCMPETMRSSETVTLESVFKHDSMSDLIKSIAERKVISLSYESFPELVAYFERKFNICIAAEEEISTIYEAIQVRNISVHNRCKIDDRFVKRTGRGKDRIGKERLLFIHDIDKIVPCVLGSVIATDKQARKKLPLKGNRFRVEDEIYPVPPLDVIAELLAEAPNGNA